MFTYTHFFSCAAIQWRKDRVSRYNSTNGSSHLDRNYIELPVGGKLLIYKWIWIFTRIQQGWLCHTLLVQTSLCLKEPNLGYWVSLRRKLNVLKDNGWMYLRVYSILECRQSEQLQVCTTKQLFTGLVSRETSPDFASLFSKKKAV